MGEWIPIEMFGFLRRPELERPGLKFEAWEAPDRTLFWLTPGLNWVARRTAYGHEIATEEEARSE